MCGEKKNTQIVSNSLLLKLLEMQSFKAEVCFNDASGFNTGP